MNYLFDTLYEASFNNTPNGNPLTFTFVKQGQCGLTIDHDYL